MAFQHGLVGITPQWLIHDFPLREGVGVGETPTSWGGAAIEVSGGYRTVHPL